MLRQRVITAVIAGLVVLVVLLFGGPESWRWLVWICTVAGIVEFSTMNKARWYGPVTLFGVLLVTFVEWFPHFFYHPFAVYLLAGIVLGVPVLSLNRVDVKGMALLTVGALYIAIGGYSLGAIRGQSHGLFWIWFLLISIWMSDTAAFFVGKLVKGPKLIPEISPKKTVSGSIGGVVGAAVGGVVFGLIVHPSVPIWTYAVMASLIAGAGQLGDLIESAYKRAAGVKDSGKLLPGHGGMLDRIDSLLFAAPFAFWLLSEVFVKWLGQ